MHDAALVTFSGIAVVLVCLPLPVQIRANNSSTLLNIFWLLLGNLTHFLNAVIWWDSAANSAPVFCDISIRVYWALSCSLSTSSLCINRRLASIASARTVAISKRQKRKQIFIDLAIGLGIPILEMIVSYIVQPHRFDILEGYGCILLVFRCLPALFLCVLWPWAITLVSMCYGIYAIRFFLTHRLQFQTLLRNSESGLNSSQYLRLIALASSEIFIALPISTFFLVFLVRDLQPFNWSEVHYNWSRVVQVPAADFSSYYGKPLEFTPIPLGRWLYVLVAFLFFLFFGISGDAIAEYGRWYERVRVLLRIGRSKSDVNASFFVPELGSTVRHATAAHRDEMPSTPRRHSLDEYEKDSISDGDQAMGTPITVLVERDIV